MKILDSSWIILRDDSLITVYGFKIVSGCLLAVSEWFLWIKNTDFCTGNKFLLVLGQCFERFLDKTLW
ncbi:hypothetical protein RhiirA4_487765 [Rhizophagus irregularis]|uniref:Uncharacterized protein n=1 Tax=Rhizophagus irregularis TaxID=588596 RepID=A0A2I1H9H3_9GLOM|nr:hypothetical protein RhiirA4_469728 [Rhizophagus irregularis]PKY55505.1 hypothetical protein RhiirA4_475007 [Rhizophagus irregularis]PKY62010.1 hypothetical protein RhiirA4_487765 [Rhizophagus irregularis]